MRKWNISENLISNLSGTLDGELVKSPQRLKSIGRRHHIKYKALKWHGLNTNGSLMVSKSEINGQETVQCKYHWKTVLVCNGEGSQKVNDKYNSEMIWILMFMMKRNPGGYWIPNPSRGFRIPSSGSKWILDSKLKIHSRVPGIITIPSDCESGFYG